MCAIIAVKRKMIRSGAATAICKNTQRIKTWTFIGLFDQVFFMRFIKMRNLYFQPNPTVCDGGEKSYGKSNGKSGKIHGKAMCSHSNTSDAMPLETFNATKNCYDPDHLDSNVLITHPLQATDCVFCCVFDIRFNKVHKQVYFYLRMIKRLSRPPSAKCKIPQISRRTAEGGPKRPDRPSFISGLWALQCMTAAEHAEPRRFRDGLPWWSDWWDEQKSGDFRRTLTHHSHEDASVEKQLYV